MKLKLNRDSEDKTRPTILVPVRSNGKWGYKLGTKAYKVEPEEDWIIKPKYDMACFFDGSSSDELLIAQVKVDEEKTYLEYSSKITDIEDITDKDVIPREELRPGEKYPTNHDGVTYSGPNFIKTTPDAQKYLNTVSKKTDDFYQIFENAWFDYDDVSKILAKAKSKFTHDHILNWGMTRYKTMNEIIAETEVWLITEDEIGKSIKVKNRFTGKGERLTIPKDLGGSPVNEKNQYPRWLIGEIKELLQMRDSLKREQMNEQIKAEKLKEIEEKLSKIYEELWGENERTHTDWLGCYIPWTGTILIKIDRVDEEADLFGCSRDLLFEKVLLHEFIHAALDLWPRDAAGNIIYNKAEWEWEDADGEFFNEESIDNAIVLKLYKGTPGYRDVKGFIETQPYYYRRAVELYESKLLPLLIEELIAYKISAPVSTIPVSTTRSTAKGGKYTYYVNGHIVASGKGRAGIGAAAYEVFSRIIPALTLSQVRALGKDYGPQFGSLPLFRDANSYKKFPNQERYYKVPINTKDGKDIYLCSQWYDNPDNRDRHYVLLQDIVRAYPALFPGISRK